MAIWAVATAGLYFLILLVLTVPVLMFTALSANASPAFEIYAMWGYWLFIALLVAAQVVLLKVPLQVASRRPVKRRALWPPVIVSAILMGLVVMTFGFTVAEALMPKDPGVLGFLAMLLMPITWVYWGIRFYNLGQTSSAMSVVEQQNALLLKGSILEFLVAVPTHIIVRGRSECCAGMYTFLGLVTGLSVMLLAFGPSVFFLFVARWRRLHPQQTPDPEAEPVHPGVV